jgi:hypothetical protein
MYADTGPSHVPVSPKKTNLMGMWALLGTTEMPKIPFAKNFQDQRFLLGLFCGIFSLM